MKRESAQNTEFYGRWRYILDIHVKILNLRKSLLVSTHFHEKYVIADIRTFKMIPLTMPQVLQ